MDNIPFEFRVGSAGAGLFVGCGAGVGILTPVSLHSIPAVGQIAGSIATSLRQLDSTFGGISWRISSALNSKAKPLGLRAGTGCGVAIGFGWGAGLMLKPTALTSLTEVIKKKMPARFVEKLENSARVGPNATATCNSVENGVQSHKIAPEATKKGAAAPSLVTQTPSPSSVELEKEVAELTKIVLKQQIALEKLNEKVDTLQLESSQQRGRKK